MSKAKTKSTPTAKLAGAEKVLAAFGSREGSNQAKVLTRLARNLGKPVAVGEVAAAVYGKDDGNRPALAMVVRGVEAKISNAKIGYRLTKGGERGTATLTLSPSR